MRWQNALEPLAADWESLTHEACNQRLRQLERLRAQGKQYLDDWEGVDLTGIKLTLFNTSLDRRAKF